MSTKYIIVSTTRNYTGDRVYSNRLAAVHDTEDSAMEEAARLANLEPEKDFFVMKSVLKVYAKRPIAVERIV